MTALTNQTLIRVLRAGNPHRPSSLDARRWEILRDGMTVGQFIFQHNLAGPLDVGGLGDRWHAVRYLRYMVERGGFIELPGVIFATRVPRGPRGQLPLSSDLMAFTVGVEFECVMPATMSSRVILTQHLVERGIETRYLNSFADHSTHPVWTVAGDHSLPRFTGAEVKSPILRGQEGIEAVARMATTLKDLGCRTTIRCGLHVHVGVQDEGVDFFRNLLRAYYLNASHIDRLVPRSRRYNRFAKQVSVIGLTDAMTKEEILRRFGGDKFVKVNLSNYATRGTVEFRQGGGGGKPDAQKTVYWVKFLLRLCNAARAGRGTQRANSLEEFLTAIGCTEDERSYLLRRAATLAPITVTVRATA
jgi:hypothetical protein